MRILLVALLAASAACIDLEGAHQKCFEDGRCGDGGTAQSDAGGSDAGGSDAGGGGGGGDAGVDAGVKYDGGTPCPGSVVPRLRCGPPIQLGTGQNLYLGQIMTWDQGFLVGWQTSTGIELTSVALDGGVTPQKSVSGLSNHRFAIDARGAGWALAYLSGSSATVTCATNANTTGQPVLMRDGGLVTYPAVAISPSGAVAIAANPDTYPSRVFAGNGTSGCPSELAPIAGIPDVNACAVVHTTGLGDDGFRYVALTQQNAGRGFVELWRREPDGGALSSYRLATLGGAPQSVAASTATSGTDVITAYSRMDTAGNYTLETMNLAADLSATGEPLPLFDGGDPGYWATSACGPGCGALIWVRYDVNGPATVAFMQDDTTGGERARYDAICGLSGTAFSDQAVGVAEKDGKLGVLHTSPTVARLFLCDMPPL